jgi:hypothetical protein
MSNRLFKVGDIAFLDTSKSGSLTCRERRNGQAVLCLGYPVDFDKYRRPINDDIMNFFCFKTNTIFSWYCTWMNDA